MLLEVMLAVLACAWYLAVLHTFHHYFIIVSPCMYMLYLLQPPDLQPTTIACFKVGWSVLKWACLICDGRKVARFKIGSVAGFEASCVASLKTYWVAGFETDSPKPFPHYIPPNQPCSLGQFGGLSCKPHPCQNLEFLIHGTRIAKIALDFSPKAV